MLKTMNLSQPMSKADYKAAAAKLRVELLQLQFQLSRRDKPVIIVIAGDDRSGRHETINTLLEWLDPRFIRVNAYGPVETQDDAKPFFWRYWKDLPEAGNVGVYLREWTSTSVVQFLNDEIDDAHLARRLSTIRHFEKTLSDDGALLIKVWLHLSKSAHQERVQKVRNTPFYDPKDELALKNFDKATQTIETVLEETDAPHAPWHVVNGDDEMQRAIVVGESIAKQIRYWLDREKPAAAAALPPTDSHTNVLDQIDLSLGIKKEVYETELDAKRQQLREVMTQAHEKGVAVVCAFEGADAAGKGGAIRRVVTALDAGLYRIVPVAKPTDVEYAHHYLWRFWKHIPANGLMTIFDRSWYGRVLVERVEGFAATHEWQRAYQEIKDFERQLTDHGVVLIKFWLHIDQDEQLKRFKSREQTAHKKHKITDEDYRNREKWPEYREAIHDMITQTDTSYAPWALIPAQDKKYARLEVLNTIITKTQAALDAL